MVAVHVDVDGMSGGVVWVRVMGAVYVGPSHTSAEQAVKSVSETVAVEE